MSNTLISDLKRQLAAERDYGKRLQKQLDAILRTDGPDEAVQPFEKIGVLHRSRSGEVSFLQDVFSIPLPVHGTLEVYMRKRQSAGEGKE